MEKNKNDRSQVFYKLSIFPKTIEKESAILKEMLNQLKSAELVRQVKQEKNLDRISSFFQSLYQIDLRYAGELLDKLGNETLTQILLKQPYKKSQKSFINTLEQINPNLAKYLSEKRLKVACLLPLLNEEKFVDELFDNLFDYVDFVIVIDDGSRDRTGRKSREFGAEVIQNFKPKGLMPSIFDGLNRALNEDIDIIVLDIFPWIKRVYIPTIIAPIIQQNADLVIGIRGNKTDIQALNRKAMKKFLKYLPAYSKKGTNRLGQTGILFSKILSVKQADIRLTSNLIRIGGAVGHVARRKYSYYRKEYDDSIYLASEYFEN